MNATDFALLGAFRGLFEGTRYLHRDSSLGDKVASFLYEDLYILNKSAKFRQRVDARERVLNVQNRTVGIARRRGDGTFGELVPASTAVVDPGYSVGRGPVATIEIGVETKILAKAMIQTDRESHWRSHSPNGGIQEAWRQSDLRWDSRREPRRSVYFLRR